MAFFYQITQSYREQVNRKQSNPRISCPLKALRYQIGIQSLTAVLMSTGSPSILEKQKPQTLSANYVFKFMQPFIQSKL